MILEGAIPLLQPDDVLFALGLGGTRPGAWADRPAPADADQRAVLKALAGDGATIDAIEQRLNWQADRLGKALRGLEFGGRVERRRGLWWPK